MTAALFSLHGRRAFVTGANAGIGRALALGLAEHGADLVLHHHGDAEGLAAVRRDAAARGRRVAETECDFAEPAAVEALADDVLAHHGPVDIFIANAAIEQRRPWETLDETHIATHVAVNFTANLLLIRRLVPAMAARGWGRVVALGSVLMRRPRAETVVYAALKAAQLTAVRAIGREVAANGVTMNVVSPGAIETGRTAGRYADAGFRAAVVSKIPAGRHGRPDDCVGPVIMLCSEAGRYVTGAEIPVDGGWSIGDPPAPAAAT